MTTFCSGVDCVQLPGQQGFQFDEYNHRKPSVYTKAVNITAHCFNDHEQR